jgi:hypothetical protein
MQARKEDKQQHSHCKSRPRATSSTLVVLGKQQQQQPLVALAPAAGDPPTATNGNSSNNVSSSPVPQVAGQRRQHTEPKQPAHNIHATQGMRRG